MRNRGEGSVRQRKSGRYEARIPIITADGVRKRVSGYGKSAKEAIADRDAKAAALQQGAPVRSSNATVAEVASMWRTTALPGFDTLSTREAYKSRCEVHIERGTLGQVRLRDLTVAHVERWVNGSKAAASSKRKDLIVLRHVLAMAVRDGLLAKNPAAQVKLPTVTRGDAEHLEMDVVVKIIERVEQRSRYGLAVRLLALTGMRRGECLALRWRDVDLSTGEIAVRGTIVGSGPSLARQGFPKSKKSRRITVPGGMVALLRAHKAAQARERLASVAWLDSDGLIFTTGAGTPVDGRNLLRMVKSAAKAVGVTQDVGVHTLRHSAATHLIYNQGVPVDVVQRMLGHADVTTTLEVYGHPSSLDVANAVSNMPSALSGVRTPVSTPELSDNDRKASGTDPL